MSVPARIWTKRSATAAVRLKRGSTHTSFALRLRLRLHDEPEADRMVLSRVAAHGQHDVRVADVGPAVGHRSSSERGGQTGHRGAVSNPGLLLDRDDAEPGAERLDEQVVDLVGVGAAADDAHRRQRVDARGRASSLLDQLLVARLLDQPRDAIDRPVPRLLFPRRAARRAVAAPWSAADR